MVLSDYLTWYLAEDMLRSAWNQKGQLLSDIFRKKPKHFRDQNPPGPSHLSIMHYANQSESIAEVETVLQQADQNPVLPDTVALVRTPEQIDDVLHQTLTEEGHQAIYNSPAPSQQSLELPADSKKSGRMNRLITKLRHPRV
jgi:hypothetical protein